MHPATIQHLLNTNDAPGDEDVQQINQILEEMTARLKIVKADVDSLPRSIKVALRDERGALEQSIASYRSIISCVRILPQEVIEEIFVHTLPSTHNAIMSSAEPPLLLGRVCSAWRAISLSMPLLWTSLHIAAPIEFPGGPVTDRNRDEEIPNLNLFQQSFKDRLVGRAKAATAWLKRARKRPLSISLLQRTATLWANANGAHIIFCLLFEALLPFRQRWKSITLAAPETSLAIAFSSFPLADPETNLPLLESVDIELEAARRSGSRRLKIEGINIFKAPRLRNINVANLFGILPWKTPLPWSHITRLWMQGPSCALTLTYALQILDTCRQLTSCALEIDDTDRNMPAVRPVDFVTLPLLEYLSISERTDATLLFESLAVPALREIAFSRQTGLNEDNPSLLVLLSKTGNVLRRLSINPRGITQEVLLKCLRLAPAVTHLSFRHMDHPGHFTLWHIPTNIPFCPMDDDILRSLTPQPGSACLCPQLENLTCTIPSVFSTRVLFEFMRQRTEFTMTGNNSLAHLKYVYVVLKQGDAGVVAAHFAHLIGLVDVRFRDTPPALKAFPDFSPWNGLRVVKEDE